MTNFNKFYQITNNFSYKKWLAQQNVTGFVLVHLWLFCLFRNMYGSLVHSRWLKASCTLSCMDVFLAWCSLALLLYLFLASRALTDRAPMGSSKWLMNIWPWHRNLCSTTQPWSHAASCMRKRQRSYSICLRQRLWASFFSECPQVSMQWPSIH
jgi:hypothetical protein